MFFVCSLRVSQPASTSKVMQRAEKRRSYPEEESQHHLPTSVNINHHPPPSHPSRLKSVSGTSSQRKFTQICTCTFTFKSRTQNHQCRKKKFPSIHFINFSILLPYRLSTARISPPKFHSSILHFLHCKFKEKTSLPPSIRQSRASKETRD